MLTFIRRWPPLIEALIVILGAFAYPTAQGLIQELQHVKVEVSENLVLTSGLYEGLALIVLCALLYVRGWDINRFGLKPERQDPLIAIGLAGTIWLLLALLFSAGDALHLVSLEPDGADKLPLNSLGTIVLVVLFSFVDAAFEELFLCGYVLALAKERGRVWLGVVAGLLLRVVYHSGDGVSGVIYSIPMSLVWAAWYLKSGRLWPVLLGHAFIQLMYFAAISQGP